MKTLPPTLLVKRTTPLNLAEAFMATSDWEGLRKFCAGTKWDAFEYMRNALPRGRCVSWARCRNQVSNGRKRSLRLSTRPEQIFGLADLARKWGWQSEAVDLWWLAAKDPINAEKTLRMLYEFYASRRDTQELYRVLVHLEKVRPTDLSVRNNLAQISLLLNLNPDQAYRAAREVYEQEPKNPDYAATYAFSLYLQGDVKKALQRLLVFPKRSWNDRKLPRTTASSWRTLVISRARRNFLIWAKSESVAGGEKARREGAVDGCTALAWLSEAARISRG